MALSGTEVGNLAEIGNVVEVENLVEVHNLAEIWVSFINTTLPPNDGNRL